MQTAIDRVIRSLTFRNALSLTEPRNQERASRAGEQAVELAAQLLGHYRETLVVRAARPD
jgi:hypothetical protein